MKKVVISFLIVLSLLIPLLGCLESCENCYTEEQLDKMGEAEHSGLKTGLGVD